MRLDGRGRWLLIAGAALVLLFGSVGAALAWEPVDVPKYVEPLVIPPEMPESPKDFDVVGPRNFDYYEIAVRQFEQYILPTDWSDANGIGPTTVWSYGSVDFPETLNYPAFTIEADVGTPTRVKWINDLVDDNGELPSAPPTGGHQTLHWANPPWTASMGDPHIDCRGQIRSPTRVRCPSSPTCTGPHTEDSDGYPEAWFLPKANNIPAGYAMGGSLYDSYKQSSRIAAGQSWDPARPSYQYDKPAAGHHPLVSRPLPGHHPPERLRRPRRFLAAPRRRGRSWSRPRPARTRGLAGARTRHRRRGRNRLLRDPHRGADPLFQPGQGALLSL